MVRLSRWCVGLICLVLLYGCPAATSFSDFDGVNLVASQDFGTTDPVSGLDNWYFAPGIDRETDLAAPHDYVEFEVVAPAVYGTLPAGEDGPVYRLELFNLFDNGTFEGTFGADWDTGGGGAPSVALALATDSDSIDGQGLRINIDNTGRVYVDLAAQILDGDFAPGGNNARYAFAFDYRANVQSFSMELNDNVANFLETPFEISSDTSSVGTVFAVPNRGSLETRLTATMAPPGNTIGYYEDAGTPTTLLSFNGINSDVQNEGLTDTIVDNIRFVRADQNHYLRLSVPATDAGRPELASGGIYTFSVWVKVDPEALIRPTGFENRNPARIVSLGLDSGTRSSAATRTDPVTTSAVFAVENATNWTQISADFNVGAFGLNILSSDDPAFDLTIEIGASAISSSVGLSPTSLRDSGSILLTGPSLTWRSQ